MRGVTMPDRSDEPTRQHRAGDSSDGRMVALESRQRDHGRRIESLEQARALVAERLAQGSTDLALLRRDVRLLLWVAGGLAAPILSALGAALVWALRASALPALAACIMLAGCTRSRETAARSWTESGTIRGTISVPTPDGILALPIDLAANRRGEETSESERKTQVDTDAIAQAVGTAIRASMSGLGGGGLPWAQILGGLGAAATTAGVGYLAMEERRKRADRLRAIDQEAKR